MADIPLTMPKMSMTMDEGTVIEWKVAAGDTIAKGDVVAVVMTDKVDMEVESPTAGTVSELRAEEGDVVAVGAPLAIIASQEEDLLGDLFSGGGSAGGTEPAGEADDAAQVTKAGQAAQVTQAAPAARSESAPPAVPLARKLARDHGLDLRDITPTGPAGTVRVKDVKQAIQNNPDRNRQQTGSGEPSGTHSPAVSAPMAAGAPVAEADPERLLGSPRERRTRQLTARAMEPTALVPQFTAFRTMDLSTTARARTGVLAGISWTTLLLRAYAVMLQRTPQLNGFFTPEGVIGNPTVDVVLAVDTPGGLMVPVIREADQMPLRELDARIREISARAKEGTVDPALLGQGTGTLSNLGGMGVDRFNALITPPQATALSLGSVGFAPRVLADGTITGQMACELGLTIDHRTADGADAARALALIQELLDDPLTLSI